MVNSTDSRAARFIDQQDKIILELKTMNTSCSLILTRNITQSSLSNFNEIYLYKCTLRVFKIRAWIFRNCAQLALRTSRVDFSDLTSQIKFLSESLLDLTRTRSSLVKTKSGYDSNRFEQIWIFHKVLKVSVIFEIIQQILKQ
jgi:hypothetical protein